MSIKTNKAEARFIILVDEDPKALEEVRELMDTEYPSAVVMHFGSASRVLEIVKQEEVGLVITESGFQDGYSGRNLIDDIRVHPKGKDIPILMLTKQSGAEINKEELEKLGVQTLQKPLSGNKLTEFVRQAMGTAFLPQGPVLTKKLKQGDYLFKEGDQGQNFFILRSGQLEALKKVKEKEISVGKISAGQVAGEMAFLDASRRSVSLRAIDDCVLTELDSKDLREYLANEPAWLEVLVESLLSRIKSLNTELASAKSI